MRTALLFALVLFAGCRSAEAPGRLAPPATPKHVAAAPVPAFHAEPAPATRVLTEDTPATTVFGAAFVAPAGWTLSVRGPVTQLDAPEGDSHLALVDVRAADADAAVTAAWTAYKPDAKWPLKLRTSEPDKDGWTERRTYLYQTSPNEKRDVVAHTRRADGGWTVSIYDMSEAVGEKRSASVTLVMESLFPKGCRS